MTEFYSSEAIFIEAVRRRLIPHEKEQKTGSILFEGDDHPGVGLRDQWW
jgi:hypothetical protein